jgi:hypothetical protein
MRDTQPRTGWIGNGCDFSQIVSAQDALRKSAKQNATAYIRGKRAIGLATIVEKGLHE